ncbi:hypothetical protein [Streptomyces sp. NPDC007088]|uniref:hypothetical protein n=1 Tax=Streptomyces sp. NPDC007088 TaxID=3364773 RepID=UPI00368E5B92
MDYDMYINGPMTDEEEATYQKARAAFDSAVRERDELPHALAKYQTAKRRLAVSHPGYWAAQQKVDETYEELQNTHTSCFHLNIRGMGAYRTVMHELGMLATDYQAPAYPELPEGVTWEDIEADEDDPNPSATDWLPTAAAAAAFVKKLDAHLSWHPEHTPGIAVHKLGSNDRWLVTPQEIEAALAAYRTHSAEEVKSRLASELGDKGDTTSNWIEWIAFLKRAKARDGFKVY